MKIDSQLPWIRLKKGQRQKQDTNRKLWVRAMKELKKNDKDNGKKLSEIQPKKNSTKSSNNKAAWMRLKQNPTNFVLQQLENNEWTTLKKYHALLNNNQNTQDLDPSWARLKKNKKLLVELTQNLMLTRHFGYHLETPVGQKSNKPW